MQRSADWLCLHPRKPSLAVSIVYMAQAAAEDYAQGRAPHLGAPFDEAAAAFFAGFAFEE